MGESGIEWTDVTDNIFVVADEDDKQHGWICAKRSAGCAKCYAESLNKNGRFSGNGMSYKRPFVFPDGLRLHFKRGMVDGWERQRKPKMHFVNSMSDTFGDWIGEEWIFYMLDGMLAAPMQTFQVLTKYHENMKQLVNSWVESRGLLLLPSNIWLMVTTENQQMANERLPYLRDTKAAVRGISVGPMLSSVRLFDAVFNWGTFIDWVVCEGESGKGARRMNKEWAVSLMADCDGEGVPFLFKQWGAFNESGERVGKKKAGRLLDGRIYNEFPVVERPFVQCDAGKDSSEWLAGSRASLDDDGDTQCKTQ